METIIGLWIIWCVLSIFFKSPEQPAPVEQQKSDLLKYMEYNSFLKEVKTMTEQEKSDALLTYIKTGIITQPTDRKFNP
jgi:hypothetical protein